MESIIQNFKEKGLPFIIVHWELFLALLIVLGIILVFERKAKINSASTLDPQRAIEWINHQHAVIIDIRDREAFRKGHIINSESIEPTNVVSVITQGKQYENKPILIVCAQGVSSAKIASQLKKEGVEKVAILKGGIQSWTSADLPLEKK